MQPGSYRVQTNKKSTCTLKNVLHIHHFLYYSCIQKEAVGQKKKKIKN